MLKKKRTHCIRVAQILWSVKFLATRPNQYFKASLNVLHPKRQFYFRYFNWKNYKSYSITAGVILAKNIQKLKFYKRSIRSVVQLSLRLKRLWFMKSKYLGLLVCKHYNRKINYFFTRFMQLVPFYTSLFIISKNSTISKKTKKRIKRRVLRLLVKQNKE